MTGVRLIVSLCIEVKRWFPETLPRLNHAVRSFAAKKRRVFPLLSAANDVVFIALFR